MQTMQRERGGKNEDRGNLQAIEHTQGTGRKQKKKAGPPTSPGSRELKVQIEKVEMFRIIKTSPKKIRSTRSCQSAF